MGFLRKAFTELKDGYRQEQKFTGKRPHPPEPDQKQPGPKKGYSVKQAVRDSPKQAWSWTKQYGSNAVKSLKESGRAPVGGGKRKKI